MDVEKADPSSSPLQPAPRAFAHRPALDGIRGLAALSVVLFHSQTPGFARGFAGVDVFFVLTGFLLGSLLLKELAEHKRVDLIEFYFRRTRRLVPLALVVLLATAIAHKIISDGLTIMGHRNGFISAALYHANWRMIWDAEDYFATTKVSPVTHYWSLSNEEQLSFLFPLILWALMYVRNYRVESRVLPILIFLLLASSAVRAFLLSYHYKNLMLAYLGTIERIYQILIGGLLAALTHTFDLKKSSHKLSLAFCLIGTFGFLGFGPDLRMNSILVGCLSAFLTFFLLLGLEINPDNIVGRILSHPVLRHFGELSYGIYLWHYPIIILGDTVGLPKTDPFRTLSVLLATYCLSYPAHIYIEVPARKFTTKFRLGAVLVGLLASLLVAVACFYILTGDAMAQQLFDNQRGTPVSRQKIICPPEMKPYLTSNTSIGSPSRVPNILFAGDSMIGVWEPIFLNILECGLNFTWNESMALGCPWYWADGYFKNDVPAEGCDRMQDEITDIVTTKKIDITFLFSWGISKTLSKNKVAAGQPGWDDLVRDGARISLRKWVIYTNLVIFLPFDVPKVPIPDCLASKGLPKPGECDQPPITYPNHDRYRNILLEVANEFSITTVDVKDFICPNNLCVSISERGKPTWGDFAHPHSTFMSEARHVMPLLALLRANCIDLANGTVSKTC